MSEAKKFVYVVSSVFDHYIMGFVRVGEKEYSLNLPKSICPDDVCSGAKFKIVIEPRDDEAERERIDQIYDDLEGMMGHS